MDDQDTGDIVAAVGPRLRVLRTRRGITLAELSDSTGISVSTLSRLESGTRKATLELLLPLAKAYAVPLDELVGAPATGDPRIHIKPVKRYGMRILPLSRGTGGNLQVFKHVIPRTSKRTEPQLKVHDGFEWLYVIKGRLRMVLGEQDLILTAGEAVEFDTRTPHWFGRVDDDSVEFLSIFGKQGERVHIAAGPRSSSSET